MATKAIKIAAVEFMKCFLEDVIATNKVIEGFKQRPIEQRLAVVTGRLVDQHEAMLNKWREKGVHGARSPLPIFLMGFDKGYASSGLEKGKSIVDRKFIVHDDLGRFLKVRVSKHDQRLQIVLYAPDHDTAFSLADQFKLYCAEFRNRHLLAYTPYHGAAYPFAMNLEDNNIFAANSQIPDQDNLTVLVFDLTFSCNTPYFLGDDVSQEPYLPVVRAVVMNYDHYLNQQRLYQKVAKDPNFTVESIN